MTAQPAASGHEQPWALLHQLMEERGFAPGSYALFFLTGEGAYLPEEVNGERIEEVSGCLIDRQERVFSFWLSWEPATRSPGLTEWEQLHPDPKWLREPEYRRARAIVGLSPG